MTDEVAVAHLFKRLAIIETTLGDVDHHRARFAALPGFATADAVSAGLFHTKRTKWA